MPAPSYVHGASSTPLLGETIGENLRRTVERVGDHEAVVSRQQGYRATYGELWDLAGKVARGLMARGVQKGDRVGIWAPNRYEWIGVQYGTARMGAILVNINPAYKTAELEYALNQSGVSFLILAQAFRTADYAGMLAEVKGRCPELREALVLESGWEALLRDADEVSETHLAEREAGRGKNGYGTWTPHTLDLVLRQETPRIGLWLDTSAMTVEETVAAILARGNETSLA